MYKWWRTSPWFWLLWCIAVLHYILTKPLSAGELLRRMMDYDFCLVNIVNSITWNLCLNRDKEPRGILVNIMHVCVSVYGSECSQCTVVYSVTRLLQNKWMPFHRGLIMNNLLNYFCEPFLQIRFLAVSKNWWQTTLNVHYSVLLCSSKHNPFIYDTDSDPMWVLLSQKKVLKLPILQGALICK